MIDFNQELEHLNSHQLAAVVYNDGPLRIIAGAGSGKTRVITMKIAYLVNNLNIPSWRILALTFTNKAAKEMRDRVEVILGNDQRINPFIATFHSFCYRVLREDGEVIGLKNPFSIIDTADQRTLIRRTIKDLGIDQKNYPRAENAALEMIEAWKTNFMDAAEAQKTSVDEQEKDFSLVYQVYEKYLQENNYVDFNDLQLKTYQLFTTDEQTRQKWADRFDHVLVDEFQDTNELQFSLIKMLRKTNPGLTVVGDPDQTIYTWRGARVEIILDFEKNFPKAKTIILDRNYRSTKQILDLANDFIDNNFNREKKDIYTDVTGVTVTVHEVTTQNSEAEYVAKTIKKLMKEKQYEYSDFFVLYRMNAWSREFEHVFDNNHLPYQLIGGIKFRDRKVIKDAVAYLKAVALNDNISVERILRATPKIGEVTISKLINYATVNDMSIFTLLTVHDQEAAQISKHLIGISDLLSKGQAKFQENLPVDELLRFLLTQSGYESRVKTLAKNDEDIENLNAFYDQLKHFHDQFDPQFYNEANQTLAFLQEEALGSDDESGVANKVTLLTIHAAKGLENKVVFVTGNSSGIFPSNRTIGNPAALEEERRAMYVGMTRAKERLYLTYVNGEYSYITNRSLEPSRFIKELNPDLYELEQPLSLPLTNAYSRTFSQSDNKSRTNSQVANSNSDLLKVGDVIEHVMFGQGVVVKIVNNNQYQIAFNNPSYGIKIIPINSVAIKKVV